ncbi:hypothetical protein DIE21_32820 [Burkholderia sp. Bp9140]|nr:hypothetical protein DIE21_32820 [Burkholderia sp. Bp9140]
MWREARRWAAGVVILVSIIVVPQYLVIALVVAALLFFGGKTNSREQTLRKSALDNAKRVASAAWSQWSSVATDKAFQEKLEEFKQMRREYEDLANRFASDKLKLQTNVRELQLRKYLENFFISDHDIPGIGPTRKATLASFGIESAADISWNQVRSVKGFGERLTHELVNWRKRLEARFVFDPSKGVDPADVAALQQRYAQLKRQLEVPLSSGPEQLKQVRLKTEQQRTLVREMVLNADLQVAQTELDYKATH